MNLAFKTPMCFLLIALICSSPVWAVICPTGHADLLVGVSAQGQLKLVRDTTEAIFLPESENAFLPGWLISDPGFNLLQTGDPNSDRFPIDAGAVVYLNVVEIDNGFQAVHPVTFAILDEPNDQIQLGTGTNMHEHLIWHINSDVVGGGWIGRLQVTFSLVDLRGNVPQRHSESKAFMMTFTNDPYPLGDIDESYLVELNDLAELADQWLSTCSGPLWCGRVNIDQSQHVDFVDYAILAEHLGETGCGP